MYRIFCNGREFGIDYATLADARRVKAAYASQWPTLAYYIRKVA